MVTDRYFLFLRFLHGTLELRITLSPVITCTSLDSVHQNIRYMIKIGVSYQKKQDRDIAAARRDMLETEDCGNVQFARLEKKS